MCAAFCILQGLCNLGSLAVSHLSCCLVLPGQLLELVAAELVPSASSCWAVSTSDSCDMEASVRLAVPRLLSCESQSSLQSM